MSEPTFYGARIDEAFGRRVANRMRKRGWVETIIPYIGYGGGEHIRLLGRAVLTPAEPHTELLRAASEAMRRRGWRNFANVTVARATITVQIGDSEMEVRSDRNGYLDVTVKNPGLEPGWHEVTARIGSSPAVELPVQIVGTDVTFGVVSDIDDTVISTFLPRALIAAWNSLVVTEQARESVPGMSRLYQKLLAEHPGAPIVYVSTGAWNTFPFLRRFLTRHGYPTGAMLLTDFGPTNTGWFRSGPDHKRRALRELARDFPQIRWLLVGDDGQHDPALYREFAELQPDHVRAIAIRELTAAQQVLAHGTATVLEDPDRMQWRPADVPFVQAPDGDALTAPLTDALAEQPQPRRGV